MAVLFVSAPADGAAQIVGFKVGATFSSLEIDADHGIGSAGSVSSFAGGGFIRFRVGDIVFQPELLVSTKGGNVRVPFIPDILEVKIDYLEVPILFRLAHPLGRTIPYALFGPAFAFEINCLVEATLDGEEETDECDEQDDVDPDLAILQTRKFDIGLTGAVGVEIRAGPGNVLIDGRYTYGLRNIAPDPFDEARNRSWAVLAGYAIELSRIWPLDVRRR